MECRRVTQLLADYRVELLDRRAHGAVEQHLDGCSACRAELAAQDRAMELVVLHASHTPPEGLWNGVFNRMSAGDRGDRFATPWWKVPFLNARRAAAGFALGTAVAAAALAVMWPRGGTNGIEPPLASTDPEVRALVRQHAMTSAESPFGDRAAWEVIIAPKGAPDQGSS